MPVAHVFTQANVRQDDQVQLGLSYRFNRTLHSSICVVSLRSKFILVLGQAKKNYGRDPQVRDFAALLDDLIYRLLTDARHGADFGANVFARASEHRIDESARCETRLAN